MTNTKSKSLKSHYFKTGKIPKKQIITFNSLQLIENEDYHIKKVFVVSGERKVSKKGKITYIPICCIMFFNVNGENAPVI